MTKFQQNKKLRGKMKGLLIMPAFLSMITTVLGHTGEDESNHHMMDGMMSGGQGYGWLIGILGIVALVLFIIWLIKRIER